MLTSASAAQDFSICFRCQYRIAFRQLRSGRRSRLMNTAVRRHISTDRRLAQESQSVASAHAEQDPSPLVHQINAAKLRRLHWNPDDIYQTLDVDAMGEPGEILMLRQRQPQARDLCADKVEDAIEDSHSNISPIEMLETLQGDCGLLDAKVVFENIQQLKETWLSQLQDRSGLPTRAEYLQMVNQLQEGFTSKQLWGYYEAHLRSSENSLDLSCPHSTQFYTRSSWKPGCSPFPGDAADQLLWLRSKQTRNRKKVKNDNKLGRHDLMVRRAGSIDNNVAEKIIREAWNLRLLEEREDHGELDLWIEPTRLAILLSDKKKSLKKWAEAFGAKVEVSQGQNIIRIASDMETCGDIFRSILCSLDNMRSVVVDLPPDPPRCEPNFLNKSLIREVESLTGTVIQKIKDSKRKRKGMPRQYRISSLGPDEDDLETARRLLSHTSLPKASKPELVVWDDRDFARGGPRPIEVGKSLPLVARGIQWSRWSTPMTRTSLPAPAQVRDLTRDWSQALSSSIFKMLFGQTKAYPLEYPKTYTGLFWSKSARRETFASLGHVLYPGDQLKKFHEALQTGQIELESQMLRKSLASQGQLVCGLPGLRSLLGVASPDGRVWEDLRITLRPSVEGSMNEEDKRKIFPDLELRISVNAVRHTCKFSGARLIVDRREVDLLLPAESADIRFCSETHIPSGVKPDPQILDFIRSSNVNVYAKERLHTPSKLRLSIPARSIRNLPKDAAVSPDTKNSKASVGSFLESGPDVAVNYTLSSVEHWSYLSGQVGSLDLEYAHIGGGQEGGRRQRFRMMVNQKDEMRLNKDGFRARFLSAMWIIGQMKELRNKYCTTRPISAHLASSIIRKDEVMGNIRRVRS